MRSPPTERSPTVTKLCDADSHPTHGPKRLEATLHGPRIVSLLPFLTDIVYELGLQHLLVGVSHECDVFPDAYALDDSRVQRVTSSKLRQVDSDAILDQTVVGDMLNSEHVSALWNNITASGTANLAPNLSQHLCSYYFVNLQKISQLNPEIILTQLDASPRTPLHPSTDEICAAARFKIPSVSRVLAVSDSMSSTVEKVFKLHENIAELAGRPESAKGVTMRAFAQLADIRKQYQNNRLNREVKVAVVQWPTPLYIAGGWVSSLLHTVCGSLASPLSHADGPSVCVENTERLFQATNVVIFALCALDIAQTRRAVSSFVARARATKTWNEAETVLAIVDGRRLFAWLGASNIVQSGQVVLEIVTGRPLYGHKGALWEYW